MSKKLFNFYLDEKLKERLKVISNHRKETLGYLLNKAVENNLKIWEEKLDNYKKLTNNL